MLIRRQCKNVILAGYVHVHCWLIHVYSRLPLAVRFLECKKAFHMYNYSLHNPIDCNAIYDISCRMDQTTSIFNQHVKTTENVWVWYLEQKKVFFIDSLRRISLKISFDLETEMKLSTWIYLLRYEHFKKQKHLLSISFKWIVNKKRFNDHSTVLILKYQMCLMRKILFSR